MERLSHNGVVVPAPYLGRGLTVKIRGEVVRLTDEQEEMAIAWAKKVGTPYVEDPVFARNFHCSFSSKLGLIVEPGDIDLSEMLRAVDEERAHKAALPREERRRLAAERKAAREALRERYGYAWVDGVRVEVGSYTVEPSCIFMGRGGHPRRGSWKEGPREEDIELNLPPNTPRPPGRWRGVVWDPGSMWIARWRDGLSGRLKYVWLSDSSLPRQRKDIEKFDKAWELGRQLDRVRRHILENLDDEDLRRRKTSTVCYLIDQLKIRVGDEKDEDEADTVGASTLRPEHVTFNGDGTVTLDFLGKDSIRHLVTAEMPEQVVRNLKEFKATAGSTLFDGVDSERVGEFLDEVVAGLSAKVFRTLYASEAVEGSLKRSTAGEDDPEFVKKHAAMLANLEAAKVCNHRRTPPKSWESSLEKKKARLEALRARAREADEKMMLGAERTKESHERRIERQAQRLRELRERLKRCRGQLAERRRLGKPAAALERRGAQLREATGRAEEGLRALKALRDARMGVLEERMKERGARDRAAIRSLELQIEAQRETRDYNLATSLKSYIDPRVYYRWGLGLGFDWRRHYPATLQKKFSWVEVEEGSAAGPHRGQTAP